MKILLGITGSVAAIKAFKLWDALEEIGEVKGVATEKSLHFIKAAALHENRKDFLSLSDQISKYKKYKFVSDHEEWQWQEIGDPVQHIDLKDWADVFVIAPLTANTLAKMANGICDNALTCIYRAWSMEKYIIIAPAMNTDMWEHPVTKQHLDILIDRHECDNFPKHGVNSRLEFLKIIYPITKKLACGTTGVGAMGDINSIINAVKNVS